MNVLHLDEQRTWRGGEQQASWLVQGLVRAGHRVLIVGRPGSAWLANPHGGVEVTRIALPLANEFDLYSAWRIAQIVRAQPVDILHAHTSHAHSLACLARRMAGRGKVVVHRRVSFPPRQDWLNRLKYAAPDRLVAVSRHVAEVLLAAGIDAARVRVAHSAVDLSRLEVAAAPRNALGVPGDAPLLVSAGALVGHKDHALLLDAFAQLRARFPQAHLLIAGEGPLRAALEAQCEALQLGASVQLLGHRGDVPALIRAADVYVSSSWSEGLGTSVLEALACGVPVVATVAGGVSEMVIDGETGWLVPNRNVSALLQALGTALDDRPCALAQAARGRAHVEAHFTAPGMVAGNIAIYEELLRP